MRMKGWVVHLIFPGRQSSLGLSDVAAVHVPLSQQPEMTMDAGSQQ